MKNSRLTTEIILNMEPERRKETTIRPLVAGQIVLAKLVTGAMEAGANMGSDVSIREEAIDIKTVTTTEIESAIGTATAAAADMTAQVDMTDIMAGAAGATHMIAMGLAVNGLASGDMVRIKGKEVTTGRSGTGGRIESAKGLDVNRFRSRTNLHSQRSSETSRTTSETMICASSLIVGNAGCKACGSFTAVKKIARRDSPTSCLKMRSH